MINHKICFIKLLYFIVKIQIINCDAERFIHLGNVIVSIMEMLPIEQNILTIDEKISDDLLIMIQNKNAESNHMHNIFTHNILKKWFSITNCQFEFLYTQRDVSKENLSLDQEDFYFLLKNLYVNNKKIYKINNLHNIHLFLQKNKYLMNIIHNKKRIQPETVKDLFLNFTEFYFLYPFYDLTIIILEGIEKNKEDFIGYFLKQYNKGYVKHDYLNCKLFFDQKQQSIANSYKKKTYTKF